LEEYGEIDVVLGVHWFVAVFEEDEEGGERVAVNIPSGALCEFWCVCDCKQPGCHFSAAIVVGGAHAEAQILRRYPLPCGV
jgi:hypothetical protein